MSTGSPIWTRYQSVENPTQIYSIRCQPETLLLVINGVQNYPPIGEVNMSEKIKVGKGGREFGKSPFLVKLKWWSSAPIGYDLYGDLWVPLLNSNIRSQIIKGVTGVYLNMLVDVRGSKIET